MGRRYFPLDLQAGHPRQEVRAIHKYMKAGGIALIVFGLIVLAFQYIPFTRVEKVAEIGPLEIKQEQRMAIPLPPILGVVAVAAGVALVVAGGRMRTA